MTKAVRLLLLLGFCTARDSRGSAIKIIRFPFDSKKCLKIHKKNLYQSWTLRGELIYMNVRFLSENAERLGNMVFDRLFR